MTRSAEWLGLAAAPTFGTMAAAAAMGEPAGPLCGGAHGSPLGGMVAMYLLMAAFHASPWLNRIDRLWRQSTTR